MTADFKSYAQYYDLFYKERNYSLDVEYLMSLTSEFIKTPPNTILELGCGTATHACKLAALGIHVTGIDKSLEMLAGAKSRAARLGIDNEILTLKAGDARNFRIENTFDVVISLFHVLSYQTANADLDAMIQTAAVHVKNGGLFVFDFWYAPAVLWQRPTVRMKRFFSEDVEVTRYANPIVHEHLNLVDVHYLVSVKERASNKTSEIREMHRMRYLFLPEIDRLLGSYGFDRLHAAEWLTGKIPSIQTWSVCIVARKR